MSSLNNQTADHPAQQHSTSGTFHYFTTLCYLEISFNLTTHTKRGKKDLQIHKDV